LYLADMYRELGNIPKATEHYKKAGVPPSQESTPVKPTN
jgi:hypothetical protein